MQSQRQVRFRAPASVLAQESSFEQIDAQFTHVFEHKVRYEDQHMVALLKSNEEVRRTISPIRPGTSQ